MKEQEIPHIPGYRLKKKIGGGGMAAVYSAEQEKTGLEAAVKVLDPSLLADEKILKRFQQEAGNASKLEHPNIVRIYDVGNMGNNHYIAVEILSESLRDRLNKQTTIPPADALTMISAIASGLNEAHKHKIIHRDIKPDNIMFRPDGSPVLVDFGIARVMDARTRLTMTGINVGTPYYMSPEQCKGEDIDGRSDIYSLGILLFELLTGHVPYKADYITALIYHHTQGPIAQLPEALQPYQPLLEAMLAKNKPDRVSNADELLNRIRDLQSTIYKTPVETITSTNTPDLSLPPHRKKMFVSIAAILLIITVGLVIYNILTSQRDAKQTHSKNKKEIRTEIHPNPQTETQIKTHTEPQPEKSPAKSPQKLPSTTPPDAKPSGISPIGPIGPGNSLPQPRKQSIPTQGAPIGAPIGARIQPAKDTNDSKDHPTLNFINLPIDVIARMNQKIKRMEISGIEADLIVGGEISLNLSILTTGQLSVVQIEDSRLLLNRPEKKEYVINLIRPRLRFAALEPIKRETGTPAIIENWRKTFKLGTFRRKIILY